MKSLANLYNPHEQSKDQLIAGFVVRLKTFESLFKDIKDSDMRYPEQHYLIEAQRGMGKTTLLLRLSYEIENDTELNSWLIPLVFKEESYYGINRLFQLWEHCANLLANKEPSFKGLYEQLQALPNNNDYERSCFNLLTHALTQQQKKLILFIDNIGEMFQSFNFQDCQRLREVLLNCPQLRIIGATSVTLEYYFTYKHPFYEFFKKITLPTLNKDDVYCLLKELAKGCDEEQTIHAIIEHQVGRVESLRILTGGVIRSIVLLFDILLDDKNGDSLKDLENVLDKVTPLYLHRMSDLEPLQREIVNAIALSWDAISPEDIARQTRRELDDILPVLTELTSLFIIHRVETPINQDYYQLHERFFNIWYLMRIADNRHGKVKVLWLVRFLQCWYDGDGLKQRARQHINALKSGLYPAKSAYYMTEAMAATGILDSETQDELLQQTKKYLAKTDVQLMAALSVSDKELYQQADDLYWSEQYQASIYLFLQIKQKNELIYFRITCAMNDLVFLYFQQHKNQQAALALAEQLPLFSIEDNIRIDCTLACVYLWNNQFAVAAVRAESFLHDPLAYEHFEADIVLYLNLLLAKQQFTAVKAYFDTPESDYAERFKPVYYAFLKLTNDANYAKIPPELSEPVADIIAKIEQMRVDYA